MAGYSHEDSLLAVLAAAKADTEKVLTYNELVKANFFSNPERALKFAEQGLALGRKIQYHYGIGRLTNNIGVWHSKKGNYQKALDAYAESLEVWERLNMKEEMPDIYMNIGSIWYKQGKYSEALEGYLNALTEYRSIQDTIHSLDALNNIGSVYMEQGQYAEALSAFMTALEFREKQNDPIQTANSCANVGAIYQLEGQKTDAKAFFQRSLDLSIEANDKFGIAASLCNLGELALEMEEWAASGEYFRKAFSIAIEVEDKHAQATALLGLARFYEHRQFADSANNAYTDALKISREIGRQHGEALALNKIGNAKLKRKDFVAADLAIRQSLSISEAINAKDLSCENYRALASIASALGNYGDAYRFQGRYIELHDSIFTVEKSKRIAEMAEIYEAQQNEKEINRLNLTNAENQLKMERSSRQVLALLAVLLPVFFLAILFFMRFRQKKKLNLEINKKNQEIQQQRDLLEAQNAQIKEINVSLEKMIAVRTKAVSEAHMELDTFLYQSAHALRRPLLRVDGLVNLIEVETDEKSRSDLKAKLNTTLGDMDQLLHKLIAVTESSHRSLQLVEIPMEEMLAEIVREHQNGARLKLEIEPGKTIVSDAYLMSKLLSPVLENAFQSLDPAVKPGTITVSVVEDEAFNYITISDNGYGIADEQLPHVFEMFYRGTNRSGGHGLGLYLAQKVAEKLHGTIEIESTAHVGTKVSIRLPRHNI